MVILISMVMVITLVMVVLHVANARTIFMEVNQLSKLLQH